MTIDKEQLNSTRSKKTLCGRLMDLYVHGFVTPIAPIILLYVAFKAPRFVFYGVSMMILLPMLIAVILTDHFGVNFGLDERETNHR
ncbi:MAG: hypothetical protein KDB27_02010 [Planctomycetales bacterium]|nr:hypothetical protein [Planctomycetales bacterium]